MNPGIARAPYAAWLVFIALFPASALALQGGNLMPEYAQFEPADAPD
jgi:hypothetical protein